MSMVARALDAVTQAALMLGAIVLYAMMAHITADVLAKVLLDSPIIGTLEIVTYIYMAACTFLPLAYVLLSRTMITVEVFTQKMSGRSIVRLESVTNLITFMYFLMLAVMGTLHAWDKTLIGEVQDATYFDLPIWPTRWVLAVSCMLAAVAALFNAVDNIQSLRTGRRLLAERLARSNKSDFNGRAI